MLRGIGAWYSAKLTSRPLATRILTTAAVGFAGDVLSQALMEGQKVKWQRSLQAFGVALCVVAPQLYLWSQHILPRIVPNPASSYRTAIASVLLDQLIFFPSLIYTYLFAIRFAEELEWQKAKAQARERFPDLLVKNWAFWPFANYFNYLFVSLKFRMLFLNFCALFWNTLTPYFARNTLQSS